MEKHLIAAGHANENQLNHARVLAVQSDASLASTLVMLGIAEEHHVATAVAEAHDLALLDNIGASPLNAVTPSSLNERFLHRHKLAVFNRDEHHIDVALTEPNEAVLAALRFAYEGEVRPVVATFSQIEELLGVPALNFEASADTGQGEDLARMIEGDSEAPVIRLVQTLLANAALRRASDVHIEPMAQRLIVRYRIDGRLIEVESHAFGLAAPIASRIKVMASLDIAETRLPQDGRLRLTVRGRDIDVRVSTSPTAYGESIVLRLLGRSELPLDLERLGLPASALEKLVRALDRPHGIILLTGPTGSGKTTTLYAALARLRRPEVKILTVEDPVEVLLEGVNQVQVRPEIGLSYAQTLRAFLRQDPDILMIGEIRDKETAEIALRAALTGHLVLSTLHTNSTTGAFTRLTDIGIEPYLAASTVNAVIAQRLIRTLCPECQATRAPSVEEVELFARSGVAAPATLSEPVGCPPCQDTGYRGRMPLIEVLEIDTALRDAVRDGSIAHRANPTPLAETLLGHGLSLAAAGRTTMSEVLRAVQAE